MEFFFSIAIGELIVHLTQKDSNMEEQKSKGKEWITD